MLKPLSDEAATQVVSNLLGAAGLPETLIKRIVAAAEGNPLYVEQMLSMLIDSGAVREDGASAALQGDADIVVPPTIHALLEARLDKLERTERAAAEPASVIGMEFPHSAVQSLAPQQLREKIGDQLQALARKHFIRPSNADGADARYRFDHHLVRDTVYNGLLKRARATMHAEFVSGPTRSTPKATAARNSRRSSAITSSRPTSTWASSVRSTRRVQRSAETGRGGWRARGGARSTR